MLDKEKKMLLPDQNVTYSSTGTGAHHLQNTDFTPSYFINMNILEEMSTKRKFMNLDDRNHPGVSSILSGSNHYYDRDKFSVRRQAEYEKINNVLFSNQRQPYFQQKESSFFHETYKEEVSNLRYIDRFGCAKQSDPSGFHSEYSSDLVRTFLNSQDKQQHGMSISHSSNIEEACLEKEKLNNNACTSKELESIYLEKQDETTIDPNNRTLVERSLCVNSSLSSERLTEIGNGFSANMDEQNKATNRRLWPIISEKIWDGSLKLNTSTTVSVVAFFKSGEKIQDVNWPANLEVKGKVRLHAFEKFIQELPRSRNRALMVISLCWKVDSCRSDLTGMMEVAKGYRESEKVGFAQIAPGGSDLYVCPRSDIIITILAKYGFFKGMAAVEDDQDSLIGCVVWRRNQSSTNDVSKDTVGKKTLIEQPLHSSGLSSQDMNSPTMETQECEKKQVMPSEKEAKVASNSPGSEAGTATALTDTRSMIIENKASLSSGISHFNTSHYSTVQTITSSIPCSFPLAPAEQKISEKPSLNLLPVNMKPADTLPLAQNSGSDEAVLVSDTPTQFVSPSQMAPVFMLGNSLPSSVSQSLGNFGSAPAPGLRPLIPVDSSNFQFQPQLEQKTHSSAGNDSNCAGNIVAPNFQVTQPLLLPGQPPSQLELLRRLLQSNENVPKDATTGPTDVLDTKVSSVPQIQKTSGASNSKGKQEEEEEDDDDLPEFDFKSACGQPEAPIIRFPGHNQQTHFPNAPPLIEKSKPSFEALQHRPMPSSFPINLTNSNEGLPFAKNFGKFVAEKTPSTEPYLLSSRPSPLKETNDFGNNPRHGFGSERKSLWDDDDDDMPEWCPPDLELPKQPLLSGRKPLPSPDTAAPLSSHAHQNHDLPRRSQSGLLGPHPTSDNAPAGGFARFSNPPKPPLGSRHRDSFRSHDGKFNKRPAPHAADGKRLRR